MCKLSRREHGVVRAEAVVVHGMAHAGDSAAAVARADGEVVAYCDSLPSTSLLPASLFVLLKQASRH